MVRAKGFFWLATRPDFVGEMSQAGALVRHQAIGQWWAAVPREEWPQDGAWRDRMLKDWDEFYGDRCQEMVFIGLDFSEAELRRSLDDCLVPDVPATTGTYRRMPWAHLRDPFPRWRLKEPS